MKATLNIELIPAGRSDFIVGTRPEYGRIFFLKKPGWTHFEGPYSLRNDHVTSGDLKSWLDHRMIFVKSAHDTPVTVITN